MSSRFERPESSYGYSEWLRNYASKLDNKLNTLEAKDKKAIHTLHTFYNSKRTTLSVYYVFFVPFMIFENIVCSLIKIKDVNEHKELSSDDVLNWNMEYVLKHLKQRRALKKELYFALENNINYIRSRRDLALTLFCRLRSMQSIEFLNLSVKVVQSLNILRLCMWDITDFRARPGSLSDAKDYYFTTFTEDALRESCDSDGAYQEPCAFYVKTQNTLYELSQDAINERQEKIFSFLKKHILCKFSSNLEYYGLLRGAKVQSLVQHLLDCGSGRSVDVDILCSCKKKMFNHAGLQAYLVRKMELALERSCRTSAPRTFVNSNPGDKTK